FATAHTAYTNANTYKATYSTACAAYAPLLAANDAAKAAYAANPCPATAAAWGAAYTPARASYQTVTYDYNLAYSGRNADVSLHNYAMSIYVSHLDDSTPPPEPE